MPEDRIPSSLGTSASRWPVRPKDWARPPTLVKPLLLVSVLVALLIPFLYLGHLRYDEEQLLLVPEVVVRPDFPVAVAHDGLPFSHHGGIVEIDDVIEANGDAGPVEPPPVESLEDATVQTPKVPLQPLTFALIMWSEHSASEGAILLKVSLTC